MTTIPTLLDFPVADVGRLDEQGLVDVFRSLVRLECKALPSAQWDVPTQTKAADGGLDGFVCWKGGPEETAHFPGRWVGFQIKAEDMGPAKCKKEMLGSDGKLSPEVDRLLRGGGTYVLVTRQQVNTRQIRERIVGMREAVKDGSDLIPEDVMLGVLGAGQLAEWMRAYPSVVHQARALLGLSVHPVVRSWAQWQALMHGAPPLAAPEDYQARIDDLRARLAAPRAVVRLTGPSGLGKTRLGLEATRPVDGDPHPVLSALTVYVARGDESERDVEAIAQAFADDGSEALLVVDDCPPTLHDRIARVCGGVSSQFRLLTMDFDLRETASRSTVNVELTPETQVLVVRAMIDEGAVDAGLDPADIDRAVAFAQGYPEIARLILDAWSSGASVADALRGQDDLVRRILFAREPHDASVQRAVEAMAVFSYFGVRTAPERLRRPGDNPGAHFDFIATRLCGFADRQALYTLTRPLVRRGVLHEAGQYMRVRPRPLALRLASAWWEQQDPEGVPALLDEIEAIGLTEPLCQQMELLGEIEPARQIIERLCGERGPFGQAETLSTAAGARVLRSFAVVHPSAAAGALDRAYGRATTAELQTVEEGRRDLVVALERLAWDEETFPIAARLLLRFAAAENERWANNATGQAAQLFRLALSGTSVPALDRLPVLREILSSGDAAVKGVGVHALGSALSTGTAFRSVGSERDGGGLSRREWYPESFDDAVVYLREVLGMLVGEAAGADPSGAVARDELAKRLVGLWTTPTLVGDVVAAVRTVAAMDEAFTRAALVELGNVLVEPERFRASDRKMLAELRAELQPTSEIGRLNHIVIDPPYYETTRRTEAGDWEDTGEPKALLVADDFAETVETWNSLLDVLNRTRGTYSVAFGRRLAERLGRPFADRALNHMVEIPEPERVWTFAGGVVLGLPADDRVAVCEHVAARDELRTGYADLLAVSGVVGRDTEALIRLFRENVLGATALQALRYVLGQLGDDLNGFLEHLLDLRPDLSGEIFEVASLHDEMRVPLRRLLLLEDVTRYGLESSRSYRWSQAATQLLRGGEDPELAEAVARHLVRSSERVRSNRPGENLFAVLLEAYFDATWPVFREALEEGQVTAMNLMSVLGASFMGGTPLYDSVPTEVLIEWAKTDLDRLPHLLARSAPIFAPEERDPLEKRVDLRGVPENPAWHPATYALIEAFGTDTRFLGVLGANLYSFGSSGYRVPYYEARIVLLGQLADSRHASVRAWARVESASFQESIRQEDEEGREERLRYGM